MKKRIISFFTAFSMTLMLFTSMPIIVSAATIVANGTCGAEGNEDNVTWTLDSDGVLTISGTGEMKSSPGWSIYNSDINTLVIQNGVTNIGESAFRNCKKITSATIPNGVTNIGKYAFYYCDELETVYCAESVSEIKDEAFTGCWKLKYLFVNHDTEVSRYGISTTAALIIKYDHHGADKYKVTEIKQNRSSETIEITDDMNIDFVAPSSRKNVAKTGHTHIYENGMCNICGDIASGTAEITGDGFSYEIATGKLTVTSNGGTTAWKDYDYILDKESVKSVEIKDTVTCINAEAFDDCENLTSVSIAENVIEIGESAFENCEKLESVIIPEISELRVIGENAFYYCNHLTEIYIPDTVTEIGMTAFAGTGLTAIPRLPDGITQISDGMFMECRSLMSAEIPESVVSIGGMAFAICPKLEYALYPAGAALGNDVFYSMDEEWNETESTVTQLKYEPDGNKRRITEIILGSGKTDVTVTDEMNVNFVNENERSKVSQEGHTHVNVNNICQICNAAISSHTHKACADSNHADCAHSEIEYEPFPSGLNIITSDKNYYLTDDLTNDTLINGIFIEGATVNLCLNGHTITTERKGFKASKNGVLNICDCKTGGCMTNTLYTEGVAGAGENGTLNIYGGKFQGQKGGGISTGENSAVNIYGGEITSAGSDCIWLRTGSTLSIYGGTIESTTDEKNGINTFGNTTININGGKVTGKKYGIYIDKNNNTVNIKDGTVIGRDNAAVYSRYGNTLNISGGEISNQSLDLCVINLGTMNISGGVFSANTDKMSFIQNHGNFSLQGSPTLINTGIRLYSADNITISGALTNTEAYTIYVDPSLPRAFTNGWDTHMPDKNTSKYFKSWYDTAKIVYRDNEAVMINYYRITYDANGGSCLIRSAEADSSDKLTTLATPTRDGYSFVGWFTEADGGEKITTDTVFTNDATIYAHWTCSDHIWGDTYEKDENDHWQICTICNAESEKNEHTFVDGKCTVCQKPDPDYEQSTDTSVTVTEPPVTDPSDTESSDTQPPVTDPSDTEPTVTEPPVTDPSDTESSDTQPPVTEPSDTEPTVTEPPVTEPTVTAPPVTEPIVTRPTYIPYFPSNNTPAPAISAIPVSKEPYLQNENGKIGWEVISDDIWATSDGEAVLVNMNGTTELPKNIISDIAGRDIDLVLIMKGGFVWTINGMNVDKAKTVDMRVKKISVIPRSTVQEFFGDTKTVQIDLRHNGDFGFTAELTIDLGDKYNGKYANSYCYKSRNFEFGDCAEIVDGQAKLRFSHASSWLMTIEDSPAVEDVSSAAAAYSSGTPIDMSSSAGRGVTIPEFDEGKGLKLSNKKRRYRILRKRKLDDIVFVY